MLAMATRRNKDQLQHERMRSTCDSFLHWLSGFLLALVLVTQTHAQGQVSFQYFYDELGQLVKVVDSTGNVIEYVYDKVGNILEIKRSTTSGLAIFNFTPSRGPVTTKVTIQGQGFSTNLLDNTVRFNGTSAQVLLATATTLVVIVPVGATTGKISVQVGANTATSSPDFTVTNAPVITSVSPKAALAGTTVTNFQVTGLNLTGSTFAFVPTFVPAAITVNSAAISPTGTTATLNLTIGVQAGQFVLVATNGEGSSDAAPSSSNTLSIVDPSRTEADDDGDGFQNGLELVFGSDPFDKNSVPSSQSFKLTEAGGSIFSVMNIVIPPPGVPAFEAVGQVFSIMNTVAPPSGVPTLEAVGPTFSVVNESNPGQASSITEAVSQTFSVQNQP
jgi:YD repeat-containing protein